MGLGHDYLFAYTVPISIQSHFSMVQFSYNYEMLTFEQEISKTNENEEVSKWFEVRARKQVRKVNFFFLLFVKPFETMEEMK